MEHVEDNRYLEHEVREFIIQWRKPLAKRLIKNQELGEFKKKVAAEMQQMKHELMAQGYWEREAMEIVRAELLYSL